MIPGILFAWFIIWLIHVFNRDQEQVRRQAIERRKFREKKRK